MKFDAKIVEFLKNFSTINPSILFKEGNIVSTFSQSKTILARAKLDYDLPMEFAIYDLSKFLGILSIMPNAEIKFGENQLTIIRGNSKIKYTYASPEMIFASPYKELPINNEIASFDLNYQDLTSLIKAANILELNDVIIEGDGSNIEMKATKIKESTSNDFSLKVGETSNIFRFTFDVNNLKFVQRDYKVILPEKGFAKFSAADIDYWVVETTLT